MLSNVSSAPINVLLLENIHAAGAEMFRQLGFNVRTAEKSLEGPALRDALADVQVLGIRSKTHVAREVLEQSPSLMAIGCFCIGTNQVDLAEAGHRGVAVFNSPFSNTRSVAELTIAEIIGLYRRLGEKSAGLHAGKWDKSAMNCHEVRGRTLGIVGYGHIGSQLSVLAEALGMRVMYFDIASKLPLGNAMPMASLEALMKAADVVSIHVPATPLTEKMVGARELAWMKPGAMLINNARGSVVDVEALAAAITGGKLGGAAADVFPAEPTGNHEKFSSPLCGLPNVILTPHIGGSTEEAQENIAREVASKLSRFLLNGSTSSAVNVPEVDLPSLRPEQHRILHFHRNVPGVLSKMHGLLAAKGVNINAEFLQSNRDVSYVILDVDPVTDTSVIEALGAIPEAIRMRTLW
jgi:D-3-phosphoglycerate dehydrogenase / 2-oxoglutarate reductase